jgi:hypothetical protein
VRNTGFSVFVKHRQRRLTLKRFLPTIDAAKSFVEELRRHRFHAQDAIFVVDESTGAVVTMPSSDVVVEAPPPANGPTSAPPPSMSFDAHAGMLLAAVEASLDETTVVLHRLVRLRRELRRFAARLGGPTEQGPPSSGGRDRATDKTIA